MLWDYAIREITRRKSRTLSFALGVVLSITLFVGVIAVSQSVDQAVTKPMKSAGADMIVQLHGKPCSYNTVKLPANLNAIPEKAFDRVGTKGVSKVAGVLEFLSFKDGHPTIVTGLNPGITDIGPIKPTTERGACCEITQGRYLRQDDTYAAVVDREFAIVEHISLGSKVVLGEKEFDVVGIINSGRTARIAGAQVFIPISTARNIVNQGDIFTTVFMKLSAQADPKAVEEEIKAATGEDVTVTTSADFLATMAGFSAMTRNMAAGMAAIVIVLASLFVIKLSLSSIAERKKEIGVMKAVGWRDRDVVALLTMENAIQSFVGGVIGCVFGYGIVYLYAMNARFAIPKAIVSYPACASSTLTTDLAINVVVSPVLLAAALLLAVGLGLLAVYAGARRIAAMLPAEALRQL